MSAPLNPVGGGACCAPQCSDAPAFRVPGPSGHDAFTFTSANFVMPPVGSTVVASVLDSAFIAVGQTLFIEQAGFMQVTTVSGLNVTLDNPGNTGNAQPGLLITSGKKVSPGGVGGNFGNAYTNTTANFTMPAINTTVLVTVIATGWMGAGQPIFITNAGIMEVSSIQSGTQVTLINLGYPQNVAPTTVVPGGQFVSPSGFNGQQGATGLGTLNSISPTTTKGDLIVDNGANAPSANDVRLGVGTDGQLLAGDSAQPIGLGWKTVLPNTAATDGDIVIFSGTTGKPMAVKDSKLLITSDGAIQSTPTGGNARGTKAVDLQVSRVAATQVASGNFSGVLCGQNNSATSADSVVAGGTTNVASALCTAVCGGQTNTASGPNAAIAGGSSNTASGTNSGIAAGFNNAATNTDAFIGGGEAHTASGVDSAVLGGIQNTASGQGATALGSFNVVSGQVASSVGGQGGAFDKFGQIGHASIQMVNTGDAQTSELVWHIQTTDATANVEMFLDGGVAVGGPFRATIAQHTAWAFHLHLIGRSSAGVCAAWECKGAIQNNAGTVSLVAAVTQSVIADGTGGTWGVSANLVVDADNTNKALRVRVTGAALTLIAWVAHARIVEVTYGIA